MKHAYSIIFILIVSLSFSQQADISLRLLPGIDYKLNTISKMRIAQIIKNDSIKTDMEIGYDTNYRVKGIVDTLYSIEGKMTRVFLLTKGSIYNDEYDTQKDDNRNLALILKAMINKPFTFKMSIKGKIYDLKGLEDIINASVDAQSGLNDIEKETFKNQLNKFYGDENIAKNLETTTATFPNGKVNMGDKWIKESISPTGLIQFKNEYELMSYSTKEAIINVNSVVSTPDNIEFMALGNMNVKTILNGNMQGVMTLDGVTGWIKNSTIKQVLSGKSIIKNETDSPEIEIPMVISGEIIITNN